MVCLYAKDSTAINLRLKQLSGEETIEIALSAGEASLAAVYKALSLDATAECPSAFVSLRVEGGEGVEGSVNSMRIQPNNSTPLLSTAFLLISSPY